MVLEKRRPLCSSLLLLLLLNVATITWAEVTEASDVTGIVLEGDDDESEDPADIWEDEEEGDVEDVEDLVTTLSDSTYAKFMRDNPRVLLEFYAPWCGHCKELAPELEKAMRLLPFEGFDPPIVIAKMDATAHYCKGTVSKFDVKGYPTMKLVADGQPPSNYDGPRNANGIITYLQEHFGETLKPLNSTEDFKEFIKTSKLPIVAVFPGTTEKHRKAYDTYLAIAEEMKHKCNFAFTNDGTIMSELKEVCMGGECEGMPSLFLFRNLDDHTAVHNGRFSKYQLEDFINTNKAPLLHELDSANMDQNSFPFLSTIFDPHMTRVTAILKTPKPGKEEDKIGLSNENMKKILEMHAGYYAGRVRFVVIANAETNQIAQMTMRKQSWTPDDLPIVAVVDHTYGNRELKKANSIKLKAFLEEMEKDFKLERRPDVPPSEAALILAEYAAITAGYIGDVMKIFDLRQAAMVTTGTVAFIIGIFSIAFV